MIDPQKLEQQRQNESNASKLKLIAAEQNTVDAKQIENATPSDLKAMGTAKLPLLLLVIGNQVQQIVIPALENIVITFVSKYQNTKICPTKAEIESLKNQRDNIVSKLNSISKTLNII